MRRARSLVVLLLIQIQFGFELIHGQDEADDNELRYMVGLSEPLGSTLEWDYDNDEQTRLLLRWNITLLPGTSGLLAFSNYDSNTDRLDVIIFGNDGKLYNGYTNEKSLLFLPKDYPKLKHTLINTENVAEGKRKKFTIEIVRPLNICDKEKRSYIIDRGTIHLLTGALSGEDFQAIKQKKTVKMDEKRMSLTLQRVQLLKSQVSEESSVISLERATHSLLRSISLRSPTRKLIWIIWIRIFSFLTSKRPTGVLDSSYHPRSWKNLIISFDSMVLSLRRVRVSFIIWNYFTAMSVQRRRSLLSIKRVQASRSRWVSLLAVVWLALGR